MTPKRVVELLTKAEFRFAKTMASIPHWYTLKGSWADASEFIAVARFIRKHGRKERFFKREYTYLHIGEYKYWTMEDNIEETTLINRAKIKK